MALWRTLARPRRAAAAAVFVVLGAIGFLPLFDGPGYEQSLASGLVVPAAAAIATALETSARTSRRPLDAVLRGLANGAILALVAFATAILHGLRAGMCDLPGGALFFSLTAGFGALMGGAWGAVAGEVGRRFRARRTACVFLSVAGPVATIFAGAARFYGSPMIFAYDPFFGFFSGTLYDTIVDQRVELATYRIGSAATLGALLLFASCLTRDGRGRLALLPLGWRAPATLRLALGFASAVLSVGMICAGPALGHWQTAATIAAALGAEISGPRCDVLYPDSIDRDEAALLLRDCEEELTADQQRLGVELGGRLREYVFADVGQKRRLMGAAQTSIAKPWRREVYVQREPYPHPILGHEIAHVVSGVFGRGPFRIAGSAWGLWPNPGLIEGTAVATSPDDDQLSDAQWARAMLDLGILPPTADVFSLGFLGENASKSYTVAGAFVGWLMATRGTALLRRWYGGEALESLTGAPWSALDDDFRRYLRSLPMPPGASAYASARFARPSVWARRCPHRVDALDAEGDQCRDERRFGRASERYDAALERDPHNWHARYERARMELALGERARGRERLGDLARDDHAPRTWRDRAEETIADDDLAHGDVEAARRGYQALAARTLDEDARRTLEVKALSSADPQGRQAIVDLLIGHGDRPPERWLGAFALGSWAHDGPPLAAYLAGKNLALHGEFQGAASWLDRALSDRHDPSIVPSVGRELLRMRAVVACALGDGRTLDEVRSQTVAADSPFAESAGSGRKEWLLRLVERCEPRGR